MKLRLLAILALLFSHPLLAADLELASPFTDHAVLQREMNVPVWGWSTPATHTYNFCLAPNTPCAVRGVVWMPDPSNLGTDKSRYAAAVAAYANSLPITYSQAKVPFVFAHPKDGGEAPKLPNAARIDFAEWPKSLAEIATQLGQATNTK